MLQPQMYRQKTSGEPAQCSAVEGSSSSEESDSELDIYSESSSSDCEESNGSMEQCYTINNLIQVFIFINRLFFFLLLLFSFICWIW